MDLDLDLAMRHLSWHDFDQAVESIARRCAQDHFSGIYGIPRGGLVLAVTLSHRLQIPLVHEPQAQCLVVDDIYETGRTVEPFRDRPDLSTWVWISKRPTDWWQAVEISSSNDWIVFPWENPSAAGDDEKLYRASRLDG
jgi:hypoxanthine phosphoribosyltransferase